MGAACEMYLTALALGLTSDAASYKSVVTSSGHFGKIDQWDWGTVNGAGTLSLYAVDNDLSQSQMESIENSIIGFADDIKQAIDQEGYPSNLNFSEFSRYPWGSNSFIVNRMIALAYAHEITRDISYQKYLLRSMDYVMGTNAMDISYITGYGEKAETDLHIAGLGQLVRIPSGLEVGSLADPTTNLSMITKHRVELLLRSLMQQGGLRRMLGAARKILSTGTVLWRGLRGTSSTRLFPSSVDVVATVLL